MASVIPDIEILNILRTELSDSSHKIITTNQIEMGYRELLRDSGKKDEDMNKSYKKYLKNLIEENIEHVSFVLKTIGKYIDQSGLDEIFRVTGIYGPATLEQIKSGKHMKRSFEAFHTLYTALSNIYIQEFLSSHPLLEKELREGLTEAITTVENLSFEDSSSIRENHETFLQLLLVQIDYFNERINFEQGFVNQGKFLHNFMKMFENLFLFVRASRQKHWDLHLTSLDQFAKYFFVFDLFNYARYSPIYRNLEILRQW